MYMCSLSSLELSGNISSLFGASSRPFYDSIFQGNFFRLRSRENVVFKFKLFLWFFCFLLSFLQTGPTEVFAVFVSIYAV